MFQNDDGKTYDCPYCHNDPSVEGWCTWGALVSEPATFNVEIEGATVVADPAQPVQPGDTYIAFNKNTKWVLLTCKSIHPNHWIEPVENAYYHDTWKSAKVISIQ